MILPSCVSQMRLTTSALRFNRESVNCMDPLPPMSGVCIQVNGSVRPLETKGLMHRWWSTAFQTSIPWWLRGKGLLVSLFSRGTGERWPSTLCMVILLDVKEEVFWSFVPIFAWSPLSDFITYHNHDRPQGRISWMHFLRTPMSVSWVSKHFQYMEICPRMLCGAFTTSLGGAASKSLLSFFFFFYLRCRYR